jgi:hypothetical protein
MFHQTRLKHISLAELCRGSAMERPPTQTLTPYRTSTLPSQPTGSTLWADTRCPKNPTPADVSPANTRLSAPQTLHYAPWIAFAVTTFACF